MKYLKYFAVLLALLLPQIVSAQANLTLIEGTGRKVTLSRDAANVYVANPGVADVQVGSNRSIFITAISAGRTTIIATDFKGDNIVSYDIQVIAENRDAAAALGGNLRVGSSGNVSVIRGTANTVNDAQTVPDVQEMLRSSGRSVVNQSQFDGENQITLRVRFVEASRDDLRDVGLDISALENIGDTAFRIGTGTFDAIAANASPTAGIRGVRGDTTLEGLIRALDSRNIIQILSEPTLTTVNGRRATFTAGGELAFPVAQSDGTVTTEFKEYGVKLDFLPTMLPNRRISINVKPEVSFVDQSASVTANGYAAPGFSVRRADTTVELASGQSFAIAGLYEQYSSRSRSGVPGLTGILGSRQNKNSETELIIFVTAYLTQPTDVRQEQPVTDVASTVGFITK